MQEREKEQNHRFVQAVYEYMNFDFDKFKHLSEQEIEILRRKPLNKFLKSLKAEAFTKRTFNILTVDYISKIDKLIIDYRKENKKIAETYENDAILELAREKKYSIPWIIANTHISRPESIHLQMSKGTVNPKNSNPDKNGKNHWLFSKEEVEILKANIGSRKKNEE